MTDGEDRVAAVDAWLHPDVRAYIIHKHWLEYAMVAFFVSGLFWIAVSSLLLRSGSLPGIVRDLGVNVKRVGRAVRDGTPHASSEL